MTIHRRRFVAALGTGAVASTAGCGGAGGSEGSSDEDDDRPAVAGRP